MIIECIKEQSLKVFSRILHLSTHVLECSMPHLALSRYELHFFLLFFSYLESLAESCKCILLMTSG